MAVERKSRPGQALEKCPVQNQCHSGRLGLSQLAGLEAGPDRATARFPPVCRAAQAGWVQDHRNCLVTGPTGSGKTYLGCALGHQACRDGQRTLYFYAPKFFRALETARADGSLFAFFKKLARTALLLIDDLGISSVSGKLYREFLELLDDRHGQGATLITSQFPVSQWHQTIADPTVADAILDRLVHNAYRIELKGESMRKGKTPAESDR